MSKLDEILDDLYTVGDKDYESRRKQQIKDLFLEMINDSKNPVPDGTYWQYDIKELRKKVNEL